MSTRKVLFYSFLVVLTVGCQGRAVEEDVELRGDVTGWSTGWSTGELEDANCQWDMSYDATVWPNLSGENAVCGNGVIEGDEECDDGNYSHWDFCSPYCRSVRVMFVTEGEFDGDFSGEGSVEEADQHCQMAAPEGASGTWQAWISEPNSTVNQRFAEAFDGWYIRSDGESLADGWWELRSGWLRRRLNHNENGECVGGQPYVWTDTSISGGLQSSSTHCSYWHSEDAGYGGVGTVWERDNHWTNDSTAWCGYQAHLYCVQIGEPEAGTTGDTYTTGDAYTTGDTYTTGQ